ncbi:MAG: tRNA lysidine(34) synthetase TilS [Rhodospirillaceae bacterium]
MSADGPLSALDFAALMDRLAPFEPRPRLAVAVSGGADSLALCLLCHDWTRARGGRVLALTVDHRLRPESTAEAATVAALLRGRGIEHEVLTWEDTAPASGLEDAARDARYRLLIGRAAGAGLFHLLLAHHREDQAETVLLRLARGSGADGLAGMARVREVPELRLLRPLLSVPRAALRATCAAAGIAWLEDPSNRSLAFARARLRGSAETLAAEGLSAGRLAGTARRLGIVRAALDAATAALLARAVTLHAAGFLSLDPTLLRDAPEEIGRRALMRCLATAGGGGHPPRQERLDRLWTALVAGLTAGRTLAGCRILPGAGRLLVMREARSAAPALPLEPGVAVWWDRRFSLRLLTGPPGLQVGALGAAGWRAVRAHASPARLTPVPEPVRASLPAILDQGGPVAVPHLGFVRPGSSIVATTRFLPATPLASADFAVA